MLETRPNFSRRVLFRLLVLGVIVLFILLANIGLLNQLYFENQKTPVGLIVNGSILVVFLLGLAKVIAALLYYTREEAALAQDRGIFLEISARKGHSLANGHVAQVAREVGAPLIVNTDSHAPGDLITREQAELVARGAGLSDAEVTALFAKAETFARRLANL